MRLPPTETLNGAPKYAGETVVPLVLGGYLHTHAVLVFQSRYWANEVKTMPAVAQPKKKQLRRESANWDRLPMRARLQRRAPANIRKRGL